MSNFTIHSVETAPDAAKPMLEDSKKSFGMVPNLHGVLAESPQALEAYKKLTGIFSATSLSAAERNVVWMTINVENRCHYCVPAHSAIAKMQGLDAASVEALRQFTLAVVRERGDVDGAAVEAFLAAGFTRQNILDVIVGVAHKTLSNYVNHLAETPVDEAFKSEAWDGPKDA